MLQGVVLPYWGRWNKSYERQYRNARENVESYRAWLQAPVSERAPLAAERKEMLDTIFWVYEVLRFARLASYLRSREPDDEIGYSILVYRLTDQDLAEALDSPPREMLVVPEADAEKTRRGAAPRKPH